MTTSSAPVAATDATASVLAAEDVTFGYRSVPALDGVSLHVGSGEFVALVGPNGSGKSTLVRLLLGLLVPDAGTVRLFGEDARALHDRWRVGYVPQRAAAATDLPATVREVVSAGRLGRSGWHSRLRRKDWEAIDHALEEVDLTALRDRRVGELSGGQQQRVAVARALASRPEIIFADEPTGNLDSRAGAEILEFMRRAVRELGQAIVMVTHDPVAAGYAQRVIFLADGSIVDEMSEPTPERVLDRLKNLGE